MRVLLTGFEPFGGGAVNPSMLALAELAREPPTGIALATCVLPVRYADAWPILRERIERSAPDLLLLTGLAGGRAGLSVERLGVNLDDDPMADNAGELACERPVLPGGPAAYFATVPVQAMVDACRAAGVEASQSHSAGTFLCNHVLYRSLHHAATLCPSLRCGFVHLPWLPEQAATRPGEPSLELTAMVAGLRAALAVAAAPPV